MKEYLLTKLQEFDHFILWSFFFGTVHTLFSPKNRSIAAYGISFFVSIPLGTLAGVLATRAKVEEYIVYLIVAGTALLAQDIVKFILKFGGYLNEHSDSIIENFFKKVFGYRRPLGKHEEDSSHTPREEDSSNR